MQSNLSLGTMIDGKYKLIGLLGSGGMGEVYRAQNVLAGRLVALKVLRPEFASSEDLTRRFFLEAQSANKIGHPNIVDVIDAGFSDNVPYLAMECLDGCNLAHALERGGPLDVGTALAVILPTLSALDAAHRHGIVHRDLKPQNIFIAELRGETRVKLLDFGIAKVTRAPGDGLQQSSSNVIFGTPDYLSPEQARGDPDVDGRSDIFAVGSVLFELLTGARPFEAPTAVATAYKVVNVEPPPLSSFSVVIPPELQQTLLAALAKDRVNRFQTAAEFSDALAVSAPPAAERRRRLTALLKLVIAKDSTIAPNAASSVAMALPFFPQAAALPHLTPAPEQAGPPPAAWPTSQSTKVSAVGDRHPSQPPYASQVLVRAPAMAARGATPAGVVPSPLARSSDPARDARDRAGASRVSTATPRKEVAATWSLRPLPPSSRGRCLVRGSLPRAVAAWVTKSRGDEALARVLHVLPSAIAQNVSSNAFNGLVWYDLETLDALIEASTALAHGGDATSWRGLARDNFAVDFKAVILRGPRPSDPAVQQRRIQSVWSRLFDFGGLELTEMPRKTLVRIDGFDPASLSLRNLTLGMLEGLLERSGRVIAGEASFAREFEIEFAS